MNTIFTRLRNVGFGLTSSLALLPAVWSLNVSAALTNISGADMIDYTAYPVTTLENVTPKVMLAMSRDHQYFLRAYNDYTDLDGDGLIEESETTYDNNFEYYGYFDPDKCYSYVERNFSGGGFIEHFFPEDFAVDHYCDTVSGDWSGNFMNWATMTRMDIIRKMIYGGRRYEDRDSHTLLERAYLPNDGHAFAKYYNGDDLGQLTPFGGVTTDGNGGNRDGIDDLEEGITICNTTREINSGSSHNTNERPLARIVKGNYKLWAAGERWQCRMDKNATNGNNPEASGINASATEPNPGPNGLTSGEYGPDFELHILACEPGFIHPSDDNENCKKYTEGNYKPQGLIQEYGEDERIHFGAFTGTYGRHLRGGVLRKNVGPLDDEINFDDGTFKADPNSAVPSVGILRTLDKFRLYGYKYRDGTYSSGDACGFREKGLNDDRCWSWGNPMSEIYAEAVRYFAGLTFTGDFDANDNSFVGGLDEDDWVDPLTSDNFCAGLNIVMINSSLNTYDADQAQIFDDIAAAGAEALTNAIGDVEGITGNDYFVGAIDGIASDELCTAKTVPGLGKVRGQCPEGPTQQGSYLVAGMAHYANTQDIRDDLSGDQTITTYAVQLSTDVPRVRVPVDADNEIQIIPSIQLSDCLDNVNGQSCDPNTGTKASGTLIDFQIVQPLVEISPTLAGGLPVDTSSSTHCSLATPQPGSGLFCGKYYSNHEVSEAGGDYDQDLWGTATYYLDTKQATPIIEIVTDVHGQSTSAGVLYGFILSGTTEDGFHAYSGINNALFSDPDPLKRRIADCSSDERFGTCQVGDPARSEKFTVSIGGAKGATFLPDPLFLAAKYGAFEDSNNNGLPDIQGEWDIRDTSGTKVPGGDGIPDTFFYVTNPAALEDALRTVFDQIIERVASGTAAAVVASEQEGTGALFQALYDPIKTDVFANEVTWMGTLHALFVDPNGFLREDSDDDDRLDDYTVDKVVEVFFDADARKARLRRFDSSTANEFTSSGTTEGELETLNPVWNARTELSSLTDVTTQRPYSDTADTGRHILTWIDADYDGIVDASETIDFDTTSITAANYAWLDVWDGITMDDTEADKLVNFIRGEEQSGYRSRTVDYDQNGTVEIMRLGDIVHSTPTVQGGPAEAFDILSLDLSYAEFRAQYAQRRNVVYVGANDGMIHAINAGFFDVTTSSFVTSLNSEVAHPLGSELWAYIPKNLLGHLQWLADEDYTHVFYNDLKPFIFDAKIFADDATHPNGWGTVLVMGMRLGGGHDGNGILLDTGHDGSAGAAAANDVQTKSAYVILDITDPEQAPTLIAEVSPPELYLTTSFPATVLMGEPDDPNDAVTPTANKWYLVLGSGPTNLGEVDSNQSAKLFAYDLRELVLGNDGVVESGPFDSDGNTTNGVGFADTGEADTFVGEITVADQDLDMKAEALYFGTIGDDLGDTGSLWRLSMAELTTPTSTSVTPSNSGWGAPFKLLDVDQPFSSRPSITIDSQFRTWILAGTGRLYNNDDKDSTETQTLYGFIDPNDLFDNTATTTASHGGFEDLTNAISFADGQVDIDGDGSYDTTYQAVEADVDAAGGWLMHYNFDPSAVLPSERTVSNLTLIGGIVLTSAFEPTSDLCGAEGESRIIGRAFNTGLVPPEGIFGQECDGCPDGNAEAIGSVDLGAGLASAPSIHIGNQDVPGKVTVIVQQSTGAITGNQAQTMGGLNNGEVSWQEFRAE